MNWQDEIITLFLFVHKNFASSLEQGQLELPIKDN